MILYKNYISMGFKDVILYQDIFVRFHIPEYGISRMLFK